MSSVQGMSCVDQDNVDQDNDQDKATGRWTAQAVPLCQRRPPSTPRRSLWNARRWVLDGGRRKVDTSERGLKRLNVDVYILKTENTGWSPC